MPAATRKGIDPSAGHCYSPRPASEGSPDVITNNQPQVRVGDKYPTHSCGSSSHDGAASEGSVTVIVNGKQMHRIGDAISCGDVSASGSPDVFVGDGVASSEIFSLAATEEIRKEAGRYAPLDDPGTIHLTPTDYPADTRAPPEKVPVQETTTEVEKATTSVECDGITSPDDNYQLSSTFKLSAYSTKTLMPHKIKEQAGLTIPDIVCNLKALSTNVIELLVAQYPGVRINSGFRSVTNGKSQHERGQACDLQWPGISVQEYLARAKWAAGNLPFDQLIFEHGNSIWLHLSYNRQSTKQRGQILTMFKEKFEPGLKLYY